MAQAAPRCRDTTRAARPATLGAFLLPRPRRRVRRRPRQARDLPAPARAAATSGSAGGGDRRQGRRRRDWAHALEVLARSSANAAHRSRRRPPRRVGRPREHHLGQVLGRADRRQRRPLDPHLQPGLAQPHAGAGRADREGPAQGSTLVFIGINVAASRSPEVPTVTPAGPTTEPVRPTQPHPSTAEHLLGRQEAAHAPEVARQAVSGVQEALRPQRRPAGHAGQEVQGARPAPGAVRAAAQHADHRAAVEGGEPPVRVKCRTLAARYKIPWRSFVATAHVPNTSFYDLWHLLKPGRTWQRLLERLDRGAPQAVQVGWRRLG